MIIKIIAPLLLIIGAFFLIGFIRRMHALYGGRKFELPVSGVSQPVDLPESGLYEVAIKRSALFGVVPDNLIIKIISASNNTELSTRSCYSIFAGRKDFSGKRIIPVVHFDIAQPGKYLFQCDDYYKLKSDDKVLISTTTTDKAILLILGLVFSGTATMAGIVLSMLAFTTNP